MIGEDVDVDVEVTDEEVFERSDSNSNNNSDSNSYNNMRSGEIARDHAARLRRLRRHSRQFIS